MSWQSFSTDHGMLLIPAITRSCLLISPHMQWRLQDIKPCISMNIFTHSYISCNRSSALQLVLFLFFFPRCPQLLLFVPFPWTKSIAELHFHQCSWWLFELFTVMLWPGAGRIQCEARNVWTIILALGEGLLLEWVHAVEVGGSKRRNSFEMSLVMVLQVKARDIK